jgi:hypothetical protein
VAVAERTDATAVFGAGLQTLPRRLTEGLHGPRDRETRGRESGGVGRPAPNLAQRCHGLNAKCRGLAALSPTQREPSA